MLTSAFYVVSFFATRGLLGWSSTDPLPPKFKLLSARIVEPHSLEGDPGAIHLWVEALDDDNFPSGVPRAYRLPYNVRLAEKTEAAIRASAEGKPQGGRTADFGNGQGGNAEATAREVTPSTITTTGGGDPSSGGPLDPQSAHGENQTINFTPLASAAHASQGREIAAPSGSRTSAGKRSWPACVPQSSIRSSRSPGKAHRHRVTRVAGCSFSPLSDVGRRLHHALHQRLFRSELKPLFVALARRSERAHRQNQLDHRPPVVKRSRPSPSGDCGILNGRPQR